jgi:hypothetical protein
MTIPQDTAPMRWSPRTAPGHQGDGMGDHALDELENEDQWVNDFIERLKLRNRGYWPRKIKRGRLGEN